MQTTVLSMLLLGVGLIVCTGIVGCLGSPSETSVTVDIVKKEMGPAELGECAYMTQMNVSNPGVTEVRGLAIRVELYDPGVQKVAAWEKVPIGTLRSGESVTATSRLQTHCRTDYTLRAYAQY